MTDYASRGARHRARTRLARPICEKLARFARKQLIRWRTATDEVISLVERASQRALVPLRLAGKGKIDHAAAWTRERGDRRHFLLFERRIMKPDIRNPIIRSPNLTSNRFSA